MRGFFRGMLALGLALAVSAGQAEDQKKPVQVGVFPYLPQAKLQELFNPIAEDFARALGRPAVLSSRTEYADYANALQQQEFDIAFIQPFDYPSASDRSGYLPLARRGEDLRALILVAVDSPLKTLDDLKGKTVANPPREAAVSRQTSIALLAAGIDPNTEVKRDYGKSHFSCMQKVLIGDADACGTARQALLHFEKEKQMSSKFRVLHETESLPNSLFVVHQRIPKKEREALRQLILGWPTTDAGRKIIETGQFIPFVAADDKDYAAVRQVMRRIGD